MQILFQPLWDLCLKIESRFQRIAKRYFPPPTPVARVINRLPLQRKSLEAYFLSIPLLQITLTVGGSVTVSLVSSLTRLDLTNKDIMLLFVFSEAVESKFVKLETVILPPTVSVSSPFIG